MAATKVTSDRFKVSSLLARRLGEHKLTVPDVLRRAGLPAGFFQQEKIYATTDELFALWRAIGETSADPAIGLKLGAEPRFERYQPSAIAAVCSRSFRDALQRIARYKQLTCPEEIRVRTSGDEATVEFIYLEAEEIQPDVLVDLGLSWILLTFAMLISLGGCEPQVKGHVTGNLKVGNDRTRLIDVVTQLLPHIGYPRTLNALRVIDEVVPPTNITTAASTAH